MRRQWALFLAAVQFLTRVPVRDIPGFQPDWTARSARWFPFVGALVGLACAAVLVLSGQRLTGVLPALLAVAAGGVVTGAFHEDGLADSADGLGGGATRGRRLEIMKDSRIGTYGVLALGLTLAIKVAALAQLPLWTGALALVAAHGAARAAAVLAMRLLPYAGDLEWAKVKPVADGVTTAEAAFALVLGGFSIVPLAMAAPRPAVAASLCGSLAAAWMTRLAKRLLGGWVGDTLGASEQLFEMAFLLGVAAWA